jgi:opacity protein-like surface antigen
MKFLGLRRAFILTLFSLGAGHVWGAGLFLRPGVSYANHQGTDVNGGTGSSVALGLTWGPTLSHEADVSWSRLPWAVEGGTVPVAGIANRTGNGDAVSILGSYRYFFGHSTDRMRPYLGLLAGNTLINGRIESRSPDGNYTGSPDGWAKSFGGVVGLTLALGRIVSFDVGYRYLQTSGIEYDTRIVGAAGFTSEPGPRSQFEELRSHIVLVALTIRL